MASIYEQGLDKNPANFVPQSPLSFIERTAQVYPYKLAVIHGELKRTWGETYARCRRLASALTKSGIRRFDTVAVMLPNTPPMVEAHFGVPMIGAVLCSLNTRLDPPAVAFMLEHGEAKVVLVDKEFSLTMKAALALMKEAGKPTPRVIDVADALYNGAGEPIGDTEYEAFIAQGDPEFAWSMPPDEWDSICLNYTSGTTGNPKGVVYSHRGAYTNAISNILEWDLPKHPRLPVDPSHVPLQWLVFPVDHCGPCRDQCLPASCGCAQRI